MFNNLFLNFPSQFAEALSYEEQIRLIAKIICELTTGFESNVDSAVKEWIEKNYNDLFFNASYNNETESIIFAKGGEL